MKTDHRNLSRQDFDFEDYDAFLEARLDRFFDSEHLSDTRDYGWSFVHDAVSLYEHGYAGLLLKVLDSQPTRERWRALKHADCIRCGKPEVGILGVMRAVETPSGEIHGFHQHSQLCSECADRVEQDLRDHGTPQPTLVCGKWWTTGGETA